MTVDYFGPKTSLNRKKNEFLLKNTKDFGSEKNHIKYLVFTELLVKN